MWSAPGTEVCRQSKWRADLTASTCLGRMTSAGKKSCLANERCWKSMLLLRAIKFGLTLASRPSMIMSQTSAH